MFVLSKAIWELEHSMSYLSKCDGCRAPCDSDALVCPSCGRPKPVSGNQALGCGCLIVIIIFVIIAMTAKWFWLLHKIVKPINFLPFCLNCSPKVWVLLSQVHGPLPWSRLPHPCWPQSKSKPLWAWLGQDCGLHKTRPLGESHCLPWLFRHCAWWINKDSQSLGISIQLGNTSYAGSRVMSMVGLVAVYCWRGLSIVPIGLLVFVLFVL